MSSPKVLRLIIGAALVPTASASLGVAQLQPLPMRGRTVAVLALPSSIGGAVTSDTRHLALKVANSLRTPGVRVVVAGADAPVPLEELTATANLSGADVTVAVRSLGPSKQCAATVTPSGVPKPPQPETVIGDAQLARLVKELRASSRAEFSASLAAGVASEVRCCPRLPTETEQYVLDGTNSPIVILSLDSSDAEVLVPELPAILKRSIAMEQK